MEVRTLVLGDTTLRKQVVPGLWTLQKGWGASRTGKKQVPPGLLQVAAEQLRLSRVRSSVRLAQRLSALNSLTLSCEWTPGPKVHQGRER